MLPKPWSSLADLLTVQTFVSPFFNAAPRYQTADSLHPGPLTTFLGLYISSLSLGCRANIFLALNENFLLKMPHITKSVIQHSFIQCSRPISGCAGNPLFFFLAWCSASFLHTASVLLLGPIGHTCIIISAFLKNRTLFNQVLVGGSTTQQAEQ